MPLTPPKRPPNRGFSPPPWLDGLFLGLAQGFFIGRIPFTPGTFGSLLGLLWVGVLLWGGSPAVYGLGTLLGIFSSIWLCGRAEQILEQTDPPSVVLDEMVAMPVCFAGWLAIHGWPASSPFQALCTDSGPWWSLGILAAFRFFDILKPWPIRQSQALPGGWGVTLDDLLAAIYVNLGVVAAWSFTLRATR